MAYIVTRHRKSGTRYTVCTRDDKGVRRSLGTFDTWEEAKKLKDESELDAYTRKRLAGAMGESNRPLQTFRDYFYDESPYGYQSIANLRPISLTGYESVLRNHVFNHFGHKAVKDITRTDVRLMVEALTKQGVGAATIARARTVVSIVLNTLVNEEVIPSNPALGVKTKKYVSKEKPVATPQESRALIDAMPTLGARALTLFLVYTGARYGEATEVRVRDVKWDKNYVRIERAVTDVGDDNNPSGTGRFYVDLPKGKEARRVWVGKPVLEIFKQIVRTFDLGPDDLLFSYRTVVPEPMQRETLLRRAGEVELTEEFIETLGLTEPNEKGYMYRHGTISGYTNARCRCQYCKQASRDNVRARKARQRQQRGEKPRSPRTNKTGHLPRDDWADIWKGACEKSGLPFHMTTHSLRHSFATTMLKSGKDIAWVQDQMGHKSITTTQTYLHRIREEEEQASSMWDDMLGMTGGDDDLDETA